MFDKGHKELLKDIANISDMAKSFQFHDFESKLLTPKLDLRDKLLDMVERLDDGEYDNEPVEVSRP